MCRNPASEEELSKSRMKKRSLEILDKMAANFEHRLTTSKRLLQIHFLRSPVQVLSESGALRALRLGRTALQGEPGKQVAVPSDLPALDLECGLVVRSVGFDILPFQVEPPSENLGGLYVSGWVKRGPQGIIASNIGDAQETAAKVVMDTQGKPAKAWSTDPVLEALRESGGRIVEFRDWQTLEAEELRRGQETGKAAAKFTSATIPRAGVARLIAECGDGVTPQTADPDQNFVHIASYVAAVPQADVEMTEAEKGAAKEVEIKFPQLSKPYAPELEAFAVLILVVKLSDKRDDKQKAMEVASAMVLWLKTSLEAQRGAGHWQSREACLRHDQMGQATLLNLLLRNYLAYSLYDQALKLVSKTSFPESRPNMQYARYLFYIGQIKAVQLEYSDSHSKLMQAIRKAPQTPDVALGFKLAASKLAIVVELLMGGVPERSFFTQKELKEHLRPYYVRGSGRKPPDVFKECTKTYEALFKKDKTLTLINRLRYNVIKTGLRSICLAYSRISLQDICTKLGLESPQDAAGVVAKAVVDGVIDATIDYDQQFVKSNQKIDLYHSCALHKRIAFCLQMHNDAVKAMAYPDENDNKDAEDPEEKREREKRELANIEEDGGDDDMMYFTLDFDRQIFYYAHSESRKSQVSKPIHFRDILGAHAGHSYEPDDLGCPGQAKVTRSLSGVLSRPRPPAPGIFPFTVRTRGKRLRLEAEVEAEVFQWIAMLNAAHRIGEDVDLLSSSTWLPDAPTASPSSRSPRSEAGKAPSVTSVEASQMSTTADADENYSELGMPSPHSKAWSETGCEELDVGEDLVHPELLPPKPLTSRMTGTVPAPPGLAPAPTLGLPSAALNGGARSEDVTTDVKQEISNKIGQQVQTLLLQAKKESEQKVTAELKLLHHAMQEMDSRLDGLVKQLDDMQVQPNQEALEQAAVVQALAKVEQQWGKELGKLKGELHQTIFAHNHNADLMKYQKETLDKIRQEIDSRNNSNPDKIRAAKAQVAKIETMSKAAQIDVYLAGGQLQGLGANALVVARAPEHTVEARAEQSIFACALMADGQHLAQSRYAEEISSDFSEVGRPAQADADQPEVKLTWRPRDDFETAEGFIIHSSKFLASQWLRWLQDGKLSEVAEKFDPDVRKVLLSESAAKEACQQAGAKTKLRTLGCHFSALSGLFLGFQDFCGCIGRSLNHGITRWLSSGLKRKPRVKRVCPGQQGVYGHRDGLEEVARRRPVPC
ncbi:Rpn3 [Symbiodinium sp. KB8]|nr:Rpn3 [Symbiodinium sp. KB8]